MPTINEMFPRRFISSADLNGHEWTLKIARIVSEEVFDSKSNDKAKKWVVYFKGAKKGLVLNVTNAESIAAITGSDDTKDWKDCDIVLYVATVRSFGEMVKAIRIKKATNAAQLDAPEDGDNFVDDPLEAEYTELEETQPQPDPDEPAPLPKLPTHPKEITATVFWKAIDEIANTFGHTTTDLRKQANQILAENGGSRVDALETIRRKAEKDGA
jgi:hypothetical protein